MRSLVQIFFLFCVLVCVPVLSLAQTSTSGYTAPALNLSPQYPEPNQSFTVSLQTNTIPKTSTRWFINGIENTSFKNLNKITVTAPSVDSKTTITARHTLADGTVLESKHTVTPMRVDLLVSSDTIVPPFYNGHRLPSSGTGVTVTALPYGATSQSPKNYTYLWKVNNKIQNGGAIAGGNVLLYSSAFENEIIVSVSVKNALGQTIAEKAQLIPIVKPELHFYEKNPLRGLSFTALPDPFIFIGEETAIRGEGYFMSKSFALSNLITEWKLGGKKIATQSDPQEITLTKQGSGSQTELSFSMRNIQPYLEGAQKSIGIKF